MAHDQPTPPLLGRGYTWCNDIAVNDIIVIIVLSSVIAIIGITAIIGIIIIVSDTINHDHDHDHGHDK